MMKTRPDLDDLLDPRSLTSITTPAFDGGAVESVSWLHQGCGPEEVHVSWRGWPASFRATRGGRGDKVQPLSVECHGPGDETLRARALTSQLTISNDIQYVRYPLLDGSLVSRSGAQVHEVAVHVHGIDGKAYVRGPVPMGELEVSLVGSRWSCAREGGTAWLIIGKRGGERLPWRRLLRHMPHMLQCLSLLWGNTIVQTRIVGLDASAHPVRHAISHDQRHGRAANRGWLVADSNPWKAGPTLEAFAQAWPRWMLAERQWGVESAASYVVRAEQTNVLEWQARDYVIAIERLAKVHSGFAKGPLLPQLQAVERSMGVEGLFSEKEHKQLVAFRNQLSHSGVLDDRPSRNRSDPYQPVGWLRTLAIRYLLHALGVKGSVMDFGAMPHKIRSTQSRRFAGPKWTP